jgi:hypothetical protein
MHTRGVLLLLSAMHSHLLLGLPQMLLQHAFLP